MGKYKRIAKGLHRYRRKDGAFSYTISFFVPKLRKTVRETVKGGSRQDAERVLKKRLAAVIEDRYELPSSDPGLTVGELADRYLEHAREHKARSVSRDEYVMARLRDFMGGKRIRDVCALDVERFRRQRRETGITPATSNRELAIIKRMFALAVDWELLDRNPARPVKLYREAERPVEVITPEDEKKLLAACPDDFRPLVVTALNTGFRRGELFNLTWEHVNLAERAIRAVETKSGKVRSVPLNQAAADALSGLPGPREGLVFRKSNGKPWTDVQKVWIRACKEAGILRVTGEPKERKKYSPTFHCLRHTFASRLVLAGVDLATVRELLGHSDIKMTMRYSHSTPTHRRGAVDALAQYGQGADDVIEFPRK